MATENRLLVFKEYLNMNFDTINMDFDTIKKVRRRTFLPKVNKKNYYKSSAKKIKVSQTK